MDIYEEKISSNVFFFNSHERPTDYNNSLSIENYTCNNKLLDLRKTWYCVLVVFNYCQFLWKNTL